MGPAGFAAPHVLHALPGRLRLHLPGWSEARWRAVEKALGRTPGVRGVQGNALTGNVLVRYDPYAVTRHELLNLVSQASTLSPVRPDLRRERSFQANSPGLRAAEPLNTPRWRGLAVRSAGRLQVTGRLAATALDLATSRGWTGPASLGLQHGLRLVVGPRLAELVSQVIDVVSHLVAGNTFRLVLSCVLAFLQLSLPTA